LPNVSSDDFRATITLVSSCSCNFPSIFVPLVPYFSEMSMCESSIVIYRLLRSKWIHDLVFNT
jgi:hypothetical protein